MSYTLYLTESEKFNSSVILILAKYFIMKFIKIVASKLYILKGNCALSSSGIINMSKSQPGKVEKNSSTIGPPAGIKPTPLRCRCNSLTTELRR